MTYIFQKAVKCWSEHFQKEMKEEGFEKWQVDRYFYILNETEIPKIFTYMWLTRVFHQIPLKHEWFKILFYEEIEGGRFVINLNFCGN